jgi:uncharacterized membrane protein (UPF0127 family)
MPSMEGFQTTDVVVGEQSLVVAVAETPAQRSQGLQGVSELPAGMDGMLFVFDVAREASFHMRTVGLDLDIWWFDEEGSLIGSTMMVTCPDGPCVSYPSPGEIMWALETPHHAYDFTPGQVLEFR